MVFLYLFCYKFFMEPYFKLHLLIPSVWRASWHDKLNARILGFLTGYAHLHQNLRIQKKQSKQVVDKQRRGSRERVSLHGYTLGEKRNRYVMMGHHGSILSTCYIFKMFHKHALSGIGRSMSFSCDIADEPNAPNSWILHNY